jgi:hypothetical protein
VAVLIGDRWATSRQVLASWSREIAHDSPMSVLRHYAILTLLVVAVLGLAYALVSYFDLFTPHSYD